MSDDPWEVDRPPSPAEEFLEKQRQAGSDIIQAIVHLLQSDIPLTPPDRELIAFRLEKKFNPVAYNKFRKELDASMLQLRWEELEKQGIIGAKRDQILMTEKKIEADALHKRQQRAKRVLNKLRDIRPRTK